MTQGIARRACLQTAAAFLLVGCSQSQPSRFYSLTNLASGEQGQKSLAATAIGVVPVALPEYLNRPQIVTRSSPTMLELAELERWIEPLDIMATRILIQNLSTLTGSDQLLVLPQRRETRFDWFLETEIMRFDVGPDGMILDCRWSIFKGESEALAVSERSVFSVEPDTSNPDPFDATARAMSVGFARLSREIAAAMMAETA